MSCAGLTMRSILRCVPDAGSGETVTPWEVSGRLDLRLDLVEQALCRAVRRGLAVRVRFGYYQLAPRRLAVGGAKQ